MKTPITGLGKYLLAFVAATAIGVPAMASTQYDQLAAFVEEGMELWHVPGMAVAVVSRDEVHFQKGFGETSSPNGAKIDKHTLFANASTTKAMVVAGMLILVDEGKLSLDDPVIRHIPELHFNDPMMTQQVTVRDLLAHRTGLPSTDVWTFLQELPLEDQIRRLEAVPPAAPLRTRHIYQNTMFEIAGLVIERLSGKRWDLFIRERLWTPIGMTETFGARGQIRAELSHVLPHNYRDETLTVADWDLPAGLADAAGSVWSSIHDMSLWAQFLLRGGVTEGGERLISEPSVEEMFNPQKLISADNFYPTVELTQPNWRSYGLGWYQQDFQGRKIDFHTGSLSGLIAIIGLDRAGDRAVVVMGNRDHAEMRHAVLWEVMDNSAPNARRDWNREIFGLYESRRDEGEEQWQEKQSQRLAKTKPSLPREEYAGRYESPAMGEIAIETSGREMYLKTARVDLAMSHWHLDTFLVEYEPWGLREFATFRIGPDGAIGSLELFGESLEPLKDSE
jgi:CubicO group peptidase (beta-lactamase class C family)